MHEPTSTRINVKEDFRYKWRKTAKLTMKVIITGIHKKKLMKMRKFYLKMRKSRRHMKMKIMAYQKTSLA